MSNIRLNKVLKELNISMSRAIDFLEEKGVKIEARPTTKIDQKIYDILVQEFQQDAKRRAKSEEVTQKKKQEKEAIKEELLKAKEEEERKKSEVIKAKAKVQEPKQVGKIDLDSKMNKNSKKAEEITKKEIEEKPVEIPKEESVSKGIKPVGKIDLSTIKSNKPTPKKAKKETVVEPNQPVKEEVKKESESAGSDKIATQYKKLNAPKITGQKIDLSKFKKTEKKGGASNKKKRTRIKKEVNIEEEKKKAAQNRGGNKKNYKGGNFRGKGRKSTPTPRVELTDEQVQKQVKETLEKLTNKGSKSKGAKHRRDRRQRGRDAREQEQQKAQLENQTLKVTEFVTASELATMMNVSVTEIISACMSLGIMVTMNQRLDAETLTLVASEFNYEVEFIDAEVEEAVQQEEDKEEDLLPRAPIVTVMGHVDHGKTSLLDYIREANVIAGESGGITQHIGAYAVELKNGQKITFLDTPGHEAFTAMRARGAQVTDLAIIVAAADDDIMPQTKEAIAHAQAAGVPMIFAINKIDKPAANPEKIKEQLANMNLLVEDWGGKIQSQDISAKLGTNIDELLEKVLLESEILELTANPNKVANGTVIEALLDRGRGYMSTILVQGGTLRIGDYVLAGSYHGKVRAMLDERGNNIKEVGPSQPVSILGLDGAPQAGDKFKVFTDEKEAKTIAARRKQLQREQSVRTQKHLTLGEIGRRIALGDFKELNIVLKGDVDGSVEALSDSLQKLSVEEIHVKIVHKGVGQITESDVLLATASDAVIIGFNVRPGVQAKAIAEREEIEIRTYSIIYDAINDVKEAMEGMLSPELKEEITGNIEIRETFKISKVGTIAGCMVLDGKVFRNSNIRIIREGVVVHEGELASLKRFKDDVKEVTKGYECGLNIKNFNDIKEGDIIEAYQEVEIKKTLK
ncbi:MAG: translation initiation factor IF-2 [Flavobacteriales bacterium]